jgi:hypothetical protein
VFPSFGPGAWHRYSAQFRKSRRHSYSENASGAYRPRILGYCSGKIADNLIQLAVRVKISQRNFHRTLMFAEGLMKEIRKSAMNAKITMTPVAGG